MNLFDKLGIIKDYENLRFWSWKYSLLLIDGGLLFIEG